VLTDLGRPHEALEVTIENVDVHRRLARVNPTASTPNLGAALTNLGRVLSRLGRLPEALETTTEAVNVYRQLAEVNPVGFQNSAVPMAWVISVLGRPGMIVSRVVASDVFDLPAAAEPAVDTWSLVSVQGRGTFGVAA
jgi:hypothetical protein